MQFHITNLVGPITDLTEAAVLKEVNLSHIPLLTNTNPTQTRSFSNTLSKPDEELSAFNDSFLIEKILNVYKSAF